MTNYNGRLSGMSVYLAGPMDRVPDGGTVWREQIKPALRKLGVHVYCPCDKPKGLISETLDNRRHLDELQRNGYWDELTDIVRKIRHVDLRLVDKSDFIIGYVPSNLVMCGTIEEIVTANRQKKPCLLWNGNSKHTFLRWLFGVIPHTHMFSSLGDLMRYLYAVHSDPNFTDTTNRWIFTGECYNECFTND